MIAPLSLLFGSVALSLASPLEVRTVSALNTAAFEEAQQKDTTATKIFSSTEIETSSGQCLLVNELSGDFRANLTPIQVAACDGSDGQLWDIITAGKHDNEAGTMLITQACMNFDPRRAAGNTVIMFSCGGRADGGGNVTNSQLFTLANTTAFSLEPGNAIGTCLAVTSGNVLDQAPCSSDATESFTFGSSNAVAVPASTTDSSFSLATTAQALASSTTSSPGCTSTCFVTVTRPRSSASTIAAQSVSSIILDTTLASSTIPETILVSSTFIASAATITASPNSTILTANPTTPVPVSRAGGTLVPSLAAESNPKDTTAVFAFSSISLKSSSGLCLFIDPTAGDFRQNLIPVAMQPCTGSPNEKFDLITSGLHNNIANSTLVVSNLTQGCLNFDPRRVANDTTILFLCGGRADGGGLITDSQLFTYGGGNEIAMKPENAGGATCLVDVNGKLGPVTCDGAADQVFSIA